jgi:hypothetical protein
MHDAHTKLRLSKAIAAIINPTKNRLSAINVIINPWRCKTPMVVDLSRLTE